MRLKSQRSCTCAYFHVFGMAMYTKQCTELVRCKGFKNAFVWEQSQLTSNAFSVSKTATACAVAQ